MADMIEKGQWLVLPYHLAKTLPNLRISPIGVVPQRDQRPRTIVDYSFSGINQETCPLAPAEAMQFGKALQRIIEDLVNADPRWGPVYLCKVDIADGFYRVDVRINDIPKLGVVLLSLPSEPELIAFPLVLPMGWKNSPPYFCAVTETIADVTNARNMRNYQPARHPLESLANTKPSPSSNQQDAHSRTTMGQKAVPVPSGPTRPPPVRRPLGKFDIYVDDFLGVAQGNARRLQRIRRVLFHTLDKVLRPNDNDDDSCRPEPISIKKLQKGDACWSTQKQVLGWLIDTIQSTLTLPPHRLDRLFDILHHSIRAHQKRVSLQKWYSVLGELRAMAIAIPGA
jgi:hypothetical protein